MVQAGIYTVFFTEECEKSNYFEWVFLYYQQKVSVFSRFFSSNNKSIPGWDHGEESIQVGVLLTGGFIRGSEPLCGNRCRCAGYAVLGTWPADSCACVHEFASGLRGPTHGLPAYVHTNWLKDLQHWRDERRIRIGYQRVAL